MTITALNNQNYQDLSVQLTGTANNALLIARENGVPPSEEIEAGASIQVPTGLVADADIVRYYQANAITPATGLSKEQLEHMTGCEGIGCWVIEVDFKVS